MALAERDSPKIDRRSKSAADGQRLALLMHSCKSEVGRRTAVMELDRSQDRRGCVTQLLAFLMQRSQAKQCDESGVVTQGPR